MSNGCYHVIFPGLWLDPAALLKGDLAKLWIRDHHGRGLDPRRLRFWQAILKLPEQEVAGWLRDARATLGKVQ